MMTMYYLFVYVKVDKVKLRSNLIESNRVKSKAQVKKPNRNAIKNAKEHHSLHVNCLVFEQVESLCSMKSAECNHEMPTSQCCCYLYHQQEIKR